jgi:cyclopropane fatty-acyl-phospholipid synthase-like methyltransferase
MGRPRSIHKTGDEQMIPIAAQNVTEVVDIPTVKEEPVQVPPSQFEEAYFQLQKENGTDLSNKGGWQKMYAYYMERVFGIRGKTVVDLGCAMGSITSAFADYGAKAIGVDISKYAKEKSVFKNINLLNVDACECASHIEENSVDFVHSMFMFNHIPEEKNEQLFAQIQKICKNDALVFVVLNLGGAKYMSGNEVVQPKWHWDSIAGKFGMKDGARGIYAKLMSTNVPGWEFMRKYHWSYLLYKVVK